MCGVNYLNTLEFKKNQDDFYKSLINDFKNEIKNFFSTEFFLFYL